MEVGKIKADTEFQLRGRELKNSQEKTRGGRIQSRDMTWVQPPEDTDAF